MSLRFSVVRSIALAFFLGLCLVAGGPAYAQETPPPSKVNIEEAKRRLQRARELYDENNFQGALVEFRRAYELAPTYRLLYDIGQVYYQLQDYPNALKSFTRFLQEGKAEVSQTQREELQREIEKLKGRVATLRIITNQLQAEVSLDDVPVGKTPLAEPILVSPGRRKITATLPGYAPATKTVEVAGLDTVDVTLDLVALAPDRADRPTPPGSPQGPSRKPADTPPATGSRTAMIAGWVTTGALAIGAGVTGALALSASSDLTKKRETFGTAPADLEDARSRTKTLALVTDVLIGASAVAAGVSIYLTVTSGSSEQGSSNARSVRVGVGPGSMSLAGTF